PVLDSTSSSPSSPALRALHSFPTRRSSDLRQAELIPEQVHHREAAPRADDLWRLWQPRKGGGAVNRVFEPAERVDHAERLGLAPREDATVREPSNLCAVELAAVGNRSDELAVDVVQQRLQNTALLDGHGPR